MRDKEDNKYLQYTFDSFCKKVLKYAARDYYRKMQTQIKRQKSLSNLSEKELQALSCTDKYFDHSVIYPVAEYDVIITDMILANALTKLNVLQRNIVLLSYFIGLTDKDIAQQLGMIRRTVTYQRNCALQKLKSILEGNM